LSKQKTILQLDCDTADELLFIGLVTCVQNFQDFSFFYKLNSANTFFFERKKDIVVYGKYFDYYFPVFEAFCENTQTVFRFFSNQSSHRIQKKEVTELFIEENENLMLINKQNIRYITTCSYSSSNFSLILQPETNLFQMESIAISSSDELFHIIQNYE
jgi:hypothetical protein